jgi:hypothetical protein
LLIPNGHSTNADVKNMKQAQDLFLTLPAVGKDGRDAKLGALKSIENSMSN